jgi:hypothetical protein
MADLLASCTSRRGNCLEAKPKATPIQPGCELDWVSLGFSCVENTTTGPRNPSIVVVRDSKRGTETMRVLIICAIVITGAVGLSGCFHHEKAVTQEPLKLG